MIFISAPYTCELYAVRRDRIKTIRNYQNHLFTNGVICVSPALEVQHAVDKRLMTVENDIWAPLNQAMINNASQVHVLCVDGWEISSDVKSNIAYAEHANVPVTYITNL